MSKTIVDLQKAILAHSTRGDTIGNFYAQSSAAANKFLQLWHRIQFDGQNTQVSPVNLPS